MRGQAVVGATLLPQINTGSGVSICGVIKRMSRRSSRASAMAGCLTRASGRPHGSDRLDDGLRRMPALLSWRARRTKSRSCRSDVACLAPGQC
jgi:hypothetical protein